MIPDKTASQPSDLQAMARRIASHADLVRFTRSKKQGGSNPSVACNRTASILVGGNCTTSLFVDALGASLYGVGIDASFTEAKFDGWILDAIGGEWASGSKQWDFAVLWLSTLGFSRGGTQRSQPDYDSIEAGIDSIYRRGARIILVGPEPLSEEIQHNSPWTTWRRQIIAEIEQRFREQALIVDTEAIVRQIGMAAWIAPRFWTTAKLACHPDASIKVAQTVGRSIALMLRPRVKAIVTDLDNTLWGGTVGEDGVDGIELDPYGKGAPYLRLQRFLKDCSERGLAIASASKNNEADAIEVFQRRKEMILGLEDFVAHQIHWEDKYRSLSRIASQLNIGLDAILFLDDNPAERAAVRMALPEVIVPELPPDPEEVVPFLLSQNLFDFSSISAEDLGRTGFYRQEAERRRLHESTFKFEDYLDHLDQSVVAQRIQIANIRRVHDLINKTNQFNLTTRRHPIHVIEKWSRDDNCFAYCYDVADRFGSAGITGVMIAIPRDEGEIAIDTWLLSCRVMGRGIEDAMFDHLLTWCDKKDIRLIRGEYIETSKNSSVSKLYDRLGFAPMNGAGQYTARRVDLSPLAPRLRFTEDSAEVEIP